MKLEFEYGQGLLGAELPDSTDIFIPGETVADPPCLPQDWDSLYAAWRPQPPHQRLPPLKDCRGRGKSVVIVIRTSSRGQPAHQPRKVAIRACLDELQRRRGGAERTCCCCSPTACTPGPPWRIQTILGPELFSEFYPTSQITSHDSEDYDHPGGPELHRPGGPRDL